MLNRKYKFCNEYILATTIFDNWNNFWRMAAFDKNCHHFVYRKHLPVIKRGFVLFALHKYNVHKIAEKIC